jgi:Collagen triple helix repeat (20 copies)
MKARGSGLLHSCTSGGATSSLCYGSAMSNHNSVIGGRRGVALGLIAGAVLAPSSVYAWGAVTSSSASSSDAIHACYQSKNAIKPLVLYRHMTGSCPAGYARITLDRTGPRGLPGRTGSKGPTGATGHVGVAGPTGAIGPVGGTGAVGPTGVTGLTGATGATGATGPSGPAGATGATGAAGTTGATGASGATGATGAAGSNGLDASGEGKSSDFTDLQNDIETAVTSASISLPTAGDILIDGTASVLLQNGTFGAASCRATLDGAVAGIASPSTVVTESAPTEPMVQNGRFTGVAAGPHVVTWSCDQNGGDGTEPLDIQAPILDVWASN